MESCTASIGFSTSSTRPAAWRSRIAASAMVIGALQSTQPLHAQVPSAFESATSLPVTGVSEATIAADFDGDGDLDLAMEQPTQNRVAVLLNRGDGRFDAAQTYPGFTYLHGLASADFDGDGDIDLFGLDEDSTAARVFRNRGDGTFEPSVGYPAGFHPSNAAIADFDGDGDLDVVASTSAGYGVQTGLLILSNDGTGNLVATASMPGTILTFLRSADVDADGHADLLGVFDSELVVLRNHGDGAFEAPFRMRVGAGIGQLQLGDLDGDGRPEVIVVQRLPPGDPAFVYAMGNVGGGAFAQPELVWPIGLDSVLTLGDANGDAQLDIVTHDPDRGVLQEFRGRGDGTFEVPIEFALRGATNSIRMADLDGDGDSDLVLTSPAGVVHLENRGDGNFDIEERNALDSYVAVRGTDLDGDGDADLVASSGGQIVTLRNRGNGTFDPAQPVPGGSSHANDLLLADFDGDGDPDIASIWEFGGVALRRNAGQGIFDSPAHVEFADPTAIAAGDVDGDGDVDLVVASLAGFFGNERQIAVLSNRGDGSFERTSRFATDYQPANVLDLTDLDGDGDLDLAYLGEYLSSAYVRNDGSGGFDSVHHLSLPGSYFGQRLLVDLDQDGDVDVLTSVYPPSLVFAANRGDGTFDPPLLLVPLAETGAGIFVATDLDGDGDLDLTDAHGVWENMGGLAFQLVDTTTAWSGYTRPLALDVDGDGDEDLVLATDLQVLRNGWRAGNAIALGDGSGAACPCGNVGAAGRGCANSVDPSGAQLRASGNARLANDSIVLRATGTANGAALWVQGTLSANNGLGAPFGDGLLGVAGTIQRLGVTPTTAGSAQYPQGFARSVHELGGVTAPGTRTYQLIYRDAASFCTPSAFNATNAVTLTWFP